MSLLSPLLFFVFATGIGILGEGVLPVGDARPGAPEAN